MNDILSAFLHGIVLALGLIVPLEYRIFLYLIKEQNSQSLVRLYLA